MTVNAFDEYFPFDAGGTVSELQWADLFRAVLTTGVVVFGDNLQVVPSNPPGQSVTVLGGRAFIDGHFGKLNAARVITVAPNVSGSLRYDRVMASVDRDLNRIDVRYEIGTAIPPTIVQNASRFDLPLALLVIPNGYTAIDNVGYITDERVFARGAFIPVEQTTAGLLYLAEKFF